MIARYALLVLCASCVNLADKLLLWPPDPRPAPGATRTTIAGPAGPMEVFTATSDAGPPAAFVLRFYGNGQIANDSVADEATAFAGMSVEVWGVNYPGFGGSAGRATLRNVATGALAAYDALARRARGRPIVVFGTSLGATAALHVAANRTIAGVVLHNGPPLRQLLLRRYGWWNLWTVALLVVERLPDELDSRINATRATAPAVFIISTEDSVVPASYQRGVRALYAGPAQVFEVLGADHNDRLPAPIVEKVRAAIAAMILVPLSATRADR